MISRCHPSIVLARSIASGISLPSHLHRARVSADDREKPRTTSTSAAPTPAPEADPWAAVFEDIASDVSPISPRSNRLSSSFFSSQPKPKTFFSSDSSHRPFRRREYSTDAKQPQADEGTSWDHVFEDLDHPFSSGGGRSLGLPPIAPSADRRPPRRKAMTAREISAFDDMFNMIFAAVNKQAESIQAAQSSAARQSPVAESFQSPSSPPPSDSASALLQETETAPTSVGRAPSKEMTDFFGKLRSHSNRMRRTTKDDELLDRKKEQMEQNDTDHELLTWAIREVFPESSTSTSEHTSPSPNPSAELARYLADPTYPHVIAHLMHVFRTKYSAPHTALAVFAHAKRRSIHSYVFGCTTPAYNERLAALWQLEGAAGLGTLESVLAEMRANGVQADGQTRALVEKVRREVGEVMLDREDEMSREAWSALARVEALVKRKATERRERRPKKTKLDAKKEHWNQDWKNSEDLELGEDRLTLQP